MQAAAVTLLALALDEGEAAALRSDDVPPDGALVRAGGRRIAVPSPARPYLVAQRLVRARRGLPFLHQGNLPLTPSDVRRLVRDGLAQLGRTLEPPDFGAALAPSQRWLMAHGLLVRPGPQRAHDPAPDDGLGRRCAHGLPAWIPVGTGGVSHSRWLCGARRPSDLRPAWKGYDVSADEVIEGVTRYAIRQAGEPAGRAWLVETRIGPLWVQSLAADPPASAEVRDAVRAAQRGSRLPGR